MCTVPVLSPWCPSHAYGHPTVLSHHHILALTLTLILAPALALALAPTLTYADPNPGTRSSSRPPYCFSPHVPADSAIIELTVSALRYLLTLVTLTLTRPLI